MRAIPYCLARVLPAAPSAVNVLATVENHHQILLPQPGLALLTSLAEVIFMPYFYASCCVFSLCACCATQSCCRVWGAGFNSTPNPSSMIRIFLSQDPNKASARNLPLSHTDQRMFFLGRVISVREPWAFLFFFGRLTEAQGPLWQQTMTVGLIAGRRLFLVSKSRRKHELT